MPAAKPVIFAIKRCSLHDGPHIRTTVFLKGCPLSCRWCHTPEGMSHAIDIVTVADQCIGCGYCVDQCPNDALRLTAKQPVRDRSCCVLCGNCVEVCPALVHEATGWVVSAPMVMTEILKDLPCYDHAGGGVTFSGGDPLFQPGFLLELLQQCGRYGINRAVDTSGHAPTATVLAVARHTDIFLFDLKVMDNARHRLHTGVGNELIHANLIALASNGHSIRLRLPLVLGVNDDENNLIQTGTFAARLPGVHEIDVLPYHRAAEASYRKPSLDSPCTSPPVPGANTIQRACSILEQFGLQVHRGG